MSKIFFRFSLFVNNIVIFGLNVSHLCPVLNIDTVNDAYNHIFTCLHVIWAFPAVCSHGEEASQMESTGEEV